MSGEPDDAEVEESADLVNLCREQYCSLACLILYKHLKSKAEVWGLVGDEGGIAHFFLMQNGRALDIGGFCSVDEMKQIFPEGICDAKRVELDLVQRMMRDAAEPEYLAIVERRIKEHIREHPELFETPP